MRFEVNTHLVTTRRRYGQKASNRFAKAKICQGEINLIRFRRKQAFRVFHFQNTVFQENVKNHFGQVGSCTISKTVKLNFSTALENNLRKSDRCFPRSFCFSRSHNKSIFLITFVRAELNKVFGCDCSGISTTYEVLLLRSTLFIS